MDNPIIRRKARLNGKKYKQNFVKILKINRHKTVSKNFNKNTVKLKIPTNKIHHTRSIDSPMNNRPLNYLNNNPDDGTIKTRLHTNDDVMTKKFINKEGLKGNTPRRKVLRKKEEDDQEQLDRLIEGYAQQIREMRKKRDQAMKESNQEMNGGQPGLREVPDVNNNQGPGYNRHLDPKSNERAKARKRGANDYLVASKWKNRLIERYFQNH